MITGRQDLRTHSTCSRLSSEDKHVGYTIVFELCLSPLRLSLLSLLEPFHPNAPCHLQIFIFVFQFESIINSVLSYRHNSHRKGITNRSIFLLKHLGSFVTCASFISLFTENGSLAYDVNRSTHQHRVTITCTKNKKYIIMLKYQLLI